ncbi:GMC oxidoreductase-domain-containing protein [Scenedesmus sp. NREL 46B-D3]|nr:GMC oxidoreductase-domain-containing protein [Scenedesmus sp. NREL 46B-D3]
MQVTGYSCVVSPPYKLVRSSRTRRSLKRDDRSIKIFSTCKMENVILALAEAIWPGLELQAVERSTVDAAALSRYLRLSGAEMKQLPEEVLKMVNNYFVGTQQQQLKLLLQLLGHRLPTLLLAGQHCLSAQWPLLQPFHQMPLEARQAVLQGWAHSSLPPLRKAYKGLKALLAAAILTHIDPATGSNPCFEALGYTQGDRLREIGLGPLPTAAEAAEEVLCSATLHIPELVAAGVDVQACLAKRGFLLAPQGGPAAAAAAAAAAPDASNQPDQQHADSAAATGNGKHSGGSRSAGGVELFYDAVIIGSGAGGGVTAALLAAAGMRVLVLEKAGWVRREDMSWLEGEAHAEMYERAGFLATEDGGINVLAGSTLGGGTKINWTASLRTPEHVRREWAAAPHSLGVLGPDSQAFSAALDAVCSRLGVSTGSHMSGPNAKLLQGLQLLGVHGEELPRNCLSKTCSAYCNFGCRSGHKQSSDATWLVDAVRMGAHVLTGVEAQRVLLEAHGGAEDGSGVPGLCAGSRQQVCWR